MSNEIYFIRCASHDWNYQYADDNWTYQNGLAEEAALLKLAVGDDTKEAIYAAWHTYFRNKGVLPLMASFVNKEVPSDLVDSDV